SFLLSLLFVFRLPFPTRRSSVLRLFLHGIDGSFPAFMTDGFPGRTRAFPRRDGPICPRESRKPCAARTIRSADTRGCGGTDGNGGRIIRRFASCRRWAGKGCNRPTGPRCARGLPSRCRSEGIGGRSE